MIKKYKEQPIWYTLMTIAIFAFAVFFLCKCCMHLLQFPGAVNEYREAADVQLTQAFLNGDNPYRLQSIEQERDMPPVLYQYSFLNSLICAGLALLLGGRVILAHYILAILAMIGSGILSYRLIDRYSQQTVLPMLGAVLTLFCHWRSGYVSTTPNSLGIFLTLLTFTIAVSPKIKHKAILTALLCILLFYTKLYFVTIAGAIFLFFLFYDRKEAFKYLGMCLCQGALSILLIHIFWPLYYTYNIYFMNGSAVWYAIKQSLSSILAFLSGTIGQIGLVIPPRICANALFLNFSENTSYVLEQYGYLITVFFPLFLILLYSLIYAGIKKTRIHVNEGDVLSYASIAIITQGLCLFVIGREKGAYLSYFLQLWVPYVIIGGLICLERFLNTTRNYMRIVLILSFVIVSLHFGYRRLPLHMMTDQEVTDWQRAASYIDDYERSGQDAYYTPILAYLAIDHGAKFYNNGHVGALEDENAMNRWNGDPLAQRFFPDAVKIIQIHEKYRNKVRENIINRKYKLITTDPDGQWVNEEILLENGYRCIDTISLAVGNAQYDVGFYVANP